MTCGDVAVFDYAVWSARYPELAATVDETMGGLYWKDAELVLENKAWSYVWDIPLRTHLLNIATAHVAQLAIMAGGVPTTPGGAAPGGGGGVGRVASASEGSVSVSYDYAAKSEQSAWWTQTPYGAFFWQVTARFRTFRYVAAPQPNFEPFYSGGARWPYGRGQW